MENEQGICNTKTIVALTILCLIGSVITYTFSTKYVFWIGNCLLGHCFSNLLRHGFDKLKGDKKPKVSESEKNMVCEVPEDSEIVLEKTLHLSKHVVNAAEMPDDEMIE